MGRSSCSMLSAGRGHNRRQPGTCSMFVQIIALQVAGDYKVQILGTMADGQQVLRHLAALHAAVPVWRRTRPSLLVQGARMTDESAADGTCSLRLQCGPAYGCAVHVSITVWPLLLTGHARSFLSQPAGLLHGIFMHSAVMPLHCHIHRSHTA